MSATKAFFPPMETDDATGATSFPAQQMTNEQATLAFAADAIPGSKVNLSNDIVPSDLDASGTAAAGSLAVGFKGFIIVPDGANADIVAFDCPVKAKIDFIRGTKTGGAGGVGDAIQVRTAAAGGGSLIGSLDLNTVADKAPVVAADLDDSVNTIAAGGQVFVRRIAGAADGSAEVVIEFTPVD